MTESLRLPTRAIHGEVSFAGGKKEEVTFFLALASPTHFGEESVDEFLEGRRAFLPMRRASGTTLVNRASIVLLAVDADAPLLSKLAGSEPTIAAGVKVEIGATPLIEGVVRAARPAKTARLSDYLNEPHAFLPVERHVGKIVFINKAAILAVTGDEG